MGVLGIHYTPPPAGEPYPWFTSYSRGSRQHMSRIKSMTTFILLTQIWMRLSQCLAVLPGFFRQCITKAHPPDQILQLSLMLPVSVND